MNSDAEHSPLCRWLIQTVRNKSERKCKTRQSRRRLQKKIASPPDFNFLNPPDVDSLIEWLQLHSFPPDCQTKNLFIYWLILIFDSIKLLIEGRKDTCSDPFGQQGVVQSCMFVPASSLVVLITDHTVHHRVTTCNPSLFIKNTNMQCT